MSRILIVSNDAVGKKMAGPAIRSWEFAQCLSKHFSVTLVAPNRNVDIQSGRFNIISVSAQRLKELAEKHDVIICQGIILSRYPFLAELPIIKVIDLYDPLPVEALEKPTGNVEDQITFHNALITHHRHFLMSGDFFLCASERQWDYWVGMLTAVGRCNPVIYNSDKTFRDLIDVVPFGISDQIPAKKRQVMKGIRPGIQKDDIVVLWGGGLWEWFDPFSLIQAMEIIKHKRPDIKLFFMGTKRPNASVTTSSVRDATYQLASRLGVLNENVFLNDWVEYEERENYLLEADIGITLHHDNVETRFSFRTRVLDYLWAGLPLITTRGDAMADLVREKGLGITVNYGDVHGIVEAILLLADDPVIREECRKNSLQASSFFQWSKILGPLIAFCESPKPAPDKKYKNHLLSFSTKPPRTWTYYLGRFKYYFRAKGFKGAMIQTLRWLSR